MDKILSIIIPTYNAEKFLDKGLSTFILEEDKQMQLLEVLIINDGTPDHSVEIAQKFVEKFPDTFRIVNKENGGHGSAINEGVKHATGRYFKCVDADDWVETKALSNLITILEQTDTPFDALIQSFRKFDISKNQYIPCDVHCDDTNKLYNLPQIMEMWPQIYEGMSFHSITYQTDFYKKVGHKLTEGVFYEDQEFATVAMCYAKTIKILEEELYVYRVGDVNQSVDASNQLKRASHFEKITFQMLKLEKHLDELAPGGKELWAKKLSMFIGSYYQIALIKNPNKRSFRKRMEKYNHEIEKRSPYIYGCVKNKYKMFRLLNRLHMSNEVFENQFSKLLRFASKILHVNKLYA